MVYEGIFTETGNRVSEEDAYVYALERVLNKEEDKKEFVEWFFSGNWKKVEEDEDERT